MKNDINSNGRAFKFQFDLQIQKIKLLKNIDIPKSSYLQVIWRRGQKNISTNLKPELKGNQQQIFFGETLSMISTCFLNSDSNEFSPKDSTVSVVIYISGSQKLFGSININLCSVLNSRSYHERGLRYFEQQLNGRAKSKILLKLSSTYLTEMMKSDQQSIGSGVHSNGYNNTSSYSITEHQRKLVDIPSKDTYSVLSYGGYGGAARYSAKKQDNSSLRKQDSAKKLEEQASKQYGSYGYSQPNFYNKTTNQYTANRGPSNIIVIPSSTSRLPRSSDSDQNKSNMGDQNSRLLIQEQTRRSKLEAEMTKNKVQNDQLKNKLSEYVRENMKLKEELKKFSDNNDSRNAQMKKQNQELRDRNYIMSNQIRQLKSRFDKYVGFQRDCAILKADKQNLLRQTKQHEDAMNNLKNELEQFKKQLARAKDSQNKLYNQVRQIKNNKIDIQEGKKRQYQNKIKDMNNQLDYYQNNCKNLSVLLRETEEKLRNTETKFKNQQSLFENFKSDHYNKLDDLAFNKDKQIKDLNEKLQAKNQQCTKYILEAQKMKNDFTKIKDERITQLQYNRNKLNQQNDRLALALKDANSKIDQLQQQKNSLNNQVRNQVVMRSKETERTRQIEQRLNQVEKKYQRQLGDIKKSNQQLEMQNVELNKILSEKTKSLQQVRGRKQQMENLMKQNLQLQLELKYKNDEVHKLSKVQQQLDKIKCKYTIQQNNLMELNDQLEKCQKDLRDKNRSYILECEKTKMLIDQRANNLKTFNEMKDELEEKKNIICNGEKQVQEMDFYIGDLERRNGALFEQNRLLQDKISESNNEQYIKQIRSLQTRNRELQSRDSEKIKSIQNLHKNLSTSNKQIKELQAISQQRYQEMVHKEQIITQLESRARQSENTFKSLDQQLNTLLQDKNILAKKNQMIMEELFSYKKKFEEEKGRSHSTVHIRTSEEYLKMKNLENELQKKDSQIKKLEKQLMTLESQNINLNIQVMKKLQDITPQ